MHASHDEYFVCTAVIFSTVFDVSIATYEVHTVQLLYLYVYTCVRVCARARIIIAIPLHCRYVNGICMKSEMKKRYITHCHRKRVIRFRRDYNHSSKSMRESSARLFLEAHGPNRVFL